MDIHENSVLCTKHRLWKKKDLVVLIVDYFVNNGYDFVELVFGEPNDFVFTEDRNKIIRTLSRKGSFYGIRLKFKNEKSIIEINSNADGVDNVHYTIYAEDQNILEETKEVLLNSIEIIKPSNDSIEKTSEFLSNNPKLVRWVIAVVVIVLGYFLGVHVLLLDIISIVFSIVPVFIIFLVISYFMRRR